MLVVAPGDIFSPPVNIGVDDITKLKKIGAEIQGRIIYAELSDIIDGGPIFSWAYRPATYCDSFCLIISGDQFQKCPLVQDLCDGESHELDFGVSR